MYYKYIKLLINLKIYFKFQLRIDVQTFAVEFWIAGIRRRPPSDVRFQNVWWKPTWPTHDSARYRANSFVPVRIYLQEFLFESYLKGQANLALILRNCTINFSLIGNRFLSMDIDDTALFMRSNSIVFAALMIC